MRKPTQYRRELKDKIVECAANMFMGNGVRSVKMDDIANQLSISKRTLYEIYNNKEELLYAVVQERHKKEDMEWKELGDNSDNVMDILVGILRMRMEQVNDISPAFYHDLNNYPSVLALISERRKLRMQKSLKFLLRGRQEGFFLADVNYELLGRIIDMVIYNTLIVSQKGIDIHEFVSISVLMFIRGICTKKGLMVIDPFLKEMKGDAKS